MNATIAPASSKFPTNPASRDFSRLGAIVSLERGRTRPDAPWAPDDVAEQLWNSKDLLPFRTLAIYAVFVAKDPRYKGVGVIHLAAAGKIEL